MTVPPALADAGSKAGEAVGCWTASDLADNCGCAVDGGAASAIAQLSTAAMNWVARARRATD